MDYYWFISIFLIFWLILNLLDRLGWLKKYNLSIDSGIFLLWRTEKGKKFIDKLVTKYEAFFQKLGKINVFTSIAAVLVVTGVLVFQLIFTVEQTETVTQLQIEEAIILPGFAIPIFYGAFALGVAIIVHEFSHGIFARLEDMGISSLGVGIFLLIPLAFVEPDEEDVEKSSRLAKIKMYAAGVSTNLYVALASMAVVALVISLAFNPVSLGLGITSVDEKSPAYNSEIRENMIIEGINNQEVTSINDYQNILSEIKPGETLKIDTRENGVFTVTLGEKEGAAYIGIGGFSLKGFQDNFKSPLMYISPQIGQMMNLFETGFYTETIPSEISLTIAQAGFWLALVNFWLGIINMMPIYPIDGGKVFKEIIDSLIDRTRYIRNKKRASKYIVTAVSVTFLMIYLLPIIVLLMF